MKKYQVLSSVGTAYICAGILFLMMVDNNMLYGILSIVSFIGGWGYHECSDTAKKEYETILSNQMYEGTGND